jgi:hypothetical protein
LKGNGARSSGLDEFLHACEDFRRGDVFLDALRFVGRFTDYAPLNAFLIYTQRPTATFVASKAKWRRQFGRTLLPTARSIVILAPMGPVTFVFDIEDTDGRALPEYFNEPHEVGGQLERSIWDNTLNNCIEKEKFRIAFSEKSFLNGACVAKNRGGDYVIEINKNLETVESWYSCLVHELGHIYCGHLGEDGGKRWKARAHLKRNQREIEAESAAYLVCRRLRLKTKAVEYVAGYLDDQEEDLKAINMNAILSAASTIEAMGKRFDPKKAKG